VIRETFAAFEKTNSPRINQLGVPEHLIRVGSEIASPDRESSGRLDAESNLVYGADDPKTYRVPDDRWLIDIPTWNRGAAGYPVVRCAQR
jgi:hypothetical protein